MRWALRQLAWLNKKSGRHPMLDGALIPARLTWGMRELIRIPGRRTGRVLSVRRQNGSTSELLPNSKFQLLASGAYGHLYDRARFFACCT